MESRLLTRPVERIALRLALVGVFSAVYAVFRYIPTFPMYGLSGTSFRAGDFLAPMLGILLGPYLAVPCIIIGTVVNYAAAPPVFLGLDFLPACSAAVVAGLIFSGKTKHAIGVYAALLGLFLILPLSTFLIKIPGGLQVPYTWLHLVALLALISPIGLSAARWSKMSTGTHQALGVLVMVFSATMASHLTGGVLYELIVFPTRGITTPIAASYVWSFLFYIYPIERFIITIVTSVFGVYALRAIRSSGLEHAFAGIRRTSYPGPTQKIDS
ncbi:MAG TPA: hypothetical protein VE955_01930 [Candidatus Dormibacteraeota bacterium]|jgi:hypothetical protein|nr:hypothetical protein [Candidatus Dormibacteraeota bacterium]